MGSCTRRTSAREHPSTPEHFSIDKSPEISTQTNDIDHAVHHEGRTFANCSVQTELQLSLTAADIVWTLTIKTCDAGQCISRGAGPSDVVDYEPEMSSIERAIIAQQHDELPAHGEPEWETESSASAGEASAMESREDESEEDKLDKLHDAEATASSVSVADRIQNIERTATCSTTAVGSVEATFHHADEEGQTEIPAFIDLGDIFDRPIGQLPIWPPARRTDADDVDMVPGQRRHCARANAISDKSWS